MKIEQKSYQGADWIEAKVAGAALHEHLEDALGRVEGEVEVPHDLAGLDVVIQ